MAMRKCEICGKEVDGRGYSTHVNSHKAGHKKSRKKTTKKKRSYTKRKPGRPRAMTLEQTIDSLSAREAMEMYDRLRARILKLFGVSADDMDSYK